jgi:hypothetical protein
MDVAVRKARDAAMQEYVREQLRSGFIKRLTYVSNVELIERCYPFHRWKEIFRRIENE